MTILVGCKLKMEFIVRILVLLFVFASITSKSIEPASNAVDNSILNLTPYVKSGKVAEARSLSAVDPALFAGVKSHSGFITVNETRRWNTFFWFFPVDSKPLSSTPLLIWLQGGPGCSSMYGLFCELGPIQVLNTTAERMPITWASDYSLLFIDNPVGTGFSYSESDTYAENEDDVGRSLLNFIQQFFQVFTKLRSAPLFITGESYAGKYIPAFGHYIHNYKNDRMPINLKGLAIGDGWIDPPNYLHNAELGLQHGFLDFDRAEEIENADALARKYWNNGDIEKYILASSIGPALLQKYAGNISIYNYMDDEDNNDSYKEFLNQKDVKIKLHVGTLPYNDFSKKAYNALSHETSLSVKPWLEELLEQYGVMCYSGQLDVTVAYSNSIYMYRNLTWSNVEIYRKARRVIVKYMNKPALYVKEGGNFVDVLVRKAGHMVPMDQPEYAKLMIDMFINKFK